MPALYAGLLAPSVVGDSSGMNPAAYFDQGTEAGFHRGASVASDALAAPAAWSGQV